MARYVDGFVIPIPKKNLKKYQKMATLGRNAWMKHGAVDYYECVGDDYIKHGIPFPKLCKLKPSETLIFAFIVFKSKAHRNQVNAKVHKQFEKDFKGQEHEMIFDMKRFTVGGFKVLVQG